jgi:hypothetical protein
MPITDKDVDLIVNRLSLVIPSKKDIQEMEERLDTKYNLTINQLDKIAGSLKAINEQVEVLGGNKDQLEDHESRLETIETKLNIAI